MHGYTIYITRRHYCVALPNDEVLKRASFETSKTKRQQRLVYICVPFTLPPMRASMQKCIANVGKILILDKIFFRFFYTFY